MGPVFGGTSSKPLLGQESAKKSYSVSQFSDAFRRLKRLLLHVNGSHGLPTFFGGVSLQTQVLLACATMPHVRVVPHMHLPSGLGVL